ncbi:MAG TPA: hypothetical protein VG889_08065 [Rhizomicrobium sp.]|nr:hypothetical protein [Rhizomicrobium sp.]
MGESCDDLADQGNYSYSHKTEEKVAADEKEPSLHLGPFNDHIAYDNQNHQERDSNALVEGNDTRILEEIRQHSGVRRKLKNHRKPPAPWMTRVSVEQ